MADSIREVRPSVRPSERANASGSLFFFFPQIEQMLLQALSFVMLLPLPHLSLH